MALEINLSIQFDPYYDNIWDKEISNR